MMDNKQEFHLLIAWNRAHLSDADITSRFPETLKLLRHFRYVWNEEYADRNFAAFYGQKLDNIAYKVNHCGSGPFDVYLVKDLCPVYEIRHTTSGDNKVNTHIFDLKKQLRELSGGSHLVHGTDSSKECMLNVASLFGTSVEGVLQRYPEEDGIIEINRNISGVPYWSSWEELFSLLNLCTDYVVLRNAKTVLANDHAIHGDTDILVKDRTVADVVLAARKMHEDKNRVMYETQFENGPQLLDVRYLGDNYYCEKWESSILDSRKTDNQPWLYIPNEDNQKYSLLYHALVHKPFVADDYKEFLLKEYGTVDRKILIENLRTYMKEKEYTFELPKDSSVFVNPDFNKDISVPARMKIQYKLRRYMNESDETNGKRRDKKIFKILYKGRNLARKSLRKIKKIAKKARNRIRKAL